MGYIIYHIVHPTRQQKPYNPFFWPTLLPLISAAATILFFFSHFSWFYWFPLTLSPTLTFFLLSTPYYSNDHSVRSPLLPLLLHSFSFFSLFLFPLLFSHHSQHPKPTATLSWPTATSTVPNHLPALLLLLLLLLLLKVNVDYALYLSMGDL